MTRKPYSDEQANDSATRLPANLLGLIMGSGRLS